MALDPDKLAFDQFDRMKRLCEAIEWLDPQGTMRVLDVGGYPGLLADCLPQREIWTLDRPECSRERYVQGAAEDLPFADGEFDLAVASDVLEHIPATSRGTVLDQLARVARQAVIVSGPFDTPGVAWTDAQLNEWHSRLQGKPHHWFEEHVRHGSPSLVETCERLSSKGGEVRAYPDGDLLRWFLLQFANLACSALPGAQGACAALARASNRHFTRGTPEGAVYRHVAVARFGGGAAAGKAGRAAPSWTAIDPAQPEDGGIEETLRALAAGLDIVVNSLAAQAATGAAGEPSPATRAYIVALETALKENATASKGLLEKTREWFRK